MRIDHVLAEELSRVLDREVDPNEIEVPPTDADRAFPAMQDAAEQGRDPRDLARDLADVVDLDVVAEVEVAGPGYVNVTLDRAAYAESAAEMLRTEGMGVEERSGRVLLEFSSPNVAKPMHVGHFRNTALGDSLRRILDFVGYDVTADNWLGDWGTQYGKLIHAFREYGSEEEFEAAPMEHMFDLYVKFHEEMEDDPEVEEKGREWAQKVEAGEDEARELWERFREASLKYHKEDYERMGVHFDRYTGESRYVDRADEILEEGLETGVFEREEDGSVAVEFADDDLPSIVVQKADGTSLYLTRDLATLKERVEDEGFDRNIYVVGAEQELHFEQLFRAADRLGYDVSGCEHVSYGLLDLPEGSMSSREGRIIRLRDVLDEAEERARAVMAEAKRVSAEPGPETAAKVGIGAVKYANLKVSRQKNIRFEWDKILSFEGDSGPYLQYANTRAKSILRKADAAPSLGGEMGGEEYALLKRLARFPDAVEAAADGREPAKVANYLSTLSEEFNTFYHACPVIDADTPEARHRRLALVDLFVQVTDTGLDLLGIEPLEEM